MNDKQIEMCKKVSVYNLEQKMLLKIVRKEVAFILPVGKTISARGLRYIDSLEFKDRKEFKCKCFLKHLTDGRESLSVRFICYSFNEETVMEELYHLVLRSAIDSRSYNPQYSAWGKYEYEDPFKAQYKQQQQRAYNPNVSATGKTMEELMRELFKQGFGGGGI